MPVIYPPPGAGGGGVTDHGALTGLADDDHAQYHTDTRGDARYYTKAQVDTALDAKAATATVTALSVSLGKQREPINYTSSGWPSRGTIPNGMADFDSSGDPAAPAPVGTASADGKVVDSWRRHPSAT